MVCPAQLRPNARNSHPKIASEIVNYKNKSTKSRFRRERNLLTYELAQQLTDKIFIPRFRFSPEI
jgi:hypothetical protein